MLNYREIDMPGQQLNNRRSFSHNLRSSLDNASSRLSFSGKTSRPSRRSISGPRSVSSLGERGVLSEAGGSDLDIPTNFSQYSMVQSEGLDSAAVEDREDPFTMPRDHSSQMPADGIHKIDTNRSVEPPSDTDGRPSSALGMREDSCSSISSTSTKWYKRFHRTSSAQRLSRAAETAEVAFNPPTSSRSLNPFSRRRSIPAIPKPSSSILGQSTEASISIGGHASNASRTLPSEHYPLSPVELPYIADACLTWLIENHAQITPGIFRVSGSTQAVKTVVEHFSAGCIRMPLEHIDLPGKQMISVHDVASCLKKYLVLLPGGLLGESLYEQLLSLAETNEKTPVESLATDLANCIQQLEDPWKYNILTVLLAFLDLVATQTSILAAEDDPKQESGFMTPFSLGIVFSPCCLGSTSGPVEMRRSSTSYSDRSARSDVTPIEEAVAVARRGAKVMQMLIAEWRDISQALLERSGDVSSHDDDVSILNIQPRTDTNQVPSRKGLHTILDSPIKAEAGSHSHTRTESIDTIVMHQKLVAGEGPSSLDMAKIDLLQARIVQLELESHEAIRNLQLQQAENAKLFSRNLDLERELALLRPKA